MGSTFSERLKEALTMRDISAAELARRTGTPESVISQYKKGCYEPKQRRLEKFSKALNVSIPWLMGADTPINNDNRAHDYLSIPNIIPLPKTKKVPLLGTIACGEPILAEENIDEYVEMSEEIKADFALRCKGDSMINVRIFDGDIVFIHMQPDVENGEIAAVIIDGEATLKKVYKFENRLELHAANPLCKDYAYSGEELNHIRIIGKAVSFLSAVGS